MKKKPAARAADPKPCEHCGHCPTCGHAPREVVEFVPVPMPYPFPAPQPVYPWGYQRTWIRTRTGTYDDPHTYRNICTTTISAEPLGVLMNCN